MARTFERLVAELDYSKAVEEHGLRFEWASVRRDEHQIRICFKNKFGNDEIFSIPWEGGNAVKTVRQALRKIPKRLIITFS